jgi:hypothetical protein
MSPNDMSNNKENNRSGFKVPADYFDQLTDRVMSEVTQSRISESAGFSVPEGYLDQLTDQVMQSVLDNSLETKVIPMNTSIEPTRTKAWFIPLIAVAALGLLLFSLQGLWESTTPGFEILEDQEVMEYVVNLNTSMDQDAMELLFADNDLLDNLSVNTQINDDELMDYLIDEVDLNQMYRE